MLEHIHRTWLVTYKLTTNHNRETMFFRIYSNFLTNPAYLFDKMGFTMRKSSLNVLVFRISNFFVNLLTWCIWMTTTVATLKKYFLKFLNTTKTYQPLCAKENYLIRSEDPELLPTLRTTLCIYVYISCIHAFCHCFVSWNDLYLDK